MTDIFISYSSADRERAKRIAEELIASGLSVWWDRVIPPGRGYAEVIEEAINAASCVVVLWSETSVASRWVRKEAAEGMRRHVLLPALLDPAPKIPFEFSDIQAADLSAWGGDRGDAEFDKLVRAVHGLLGDGTRPTPAPLPPTPTPTPTAGRRRAAALAGVTAAALVGVVAWRWWPRAAREPGRDVATSPSSGAASGVSPAGSSLGMLHDDARRWSQQARESGLVARNAALDSSSDSRSARELARQLPAAAGLSQDLGMISTKARLADAAADRAEAAARRAFDVIAGWPTGPDAAARAIATQKTGEAKSAALEGEQAAAEAKAYRAEVKAAFERVRRRVEPR